MRIAPFPAMTDAQVRPVAITSKQGLALVETAR
jgi:hypothetical protein